MISPTEPPRRLATFVPTTRSHVRARRPHDEPVLLGRSRLAPERQRRGEVEHAGELLIAAVTSRSSAQTAPDSPHVAIDVANSRPGETIALPECDRRAAGAVRPSNTAESGRMRQRPAFAAPQIRASTITSCVGTDRIEGRCDLDHRAFAWPGGAVISSLPPHALLQLSRAAAGSTLVSVDARRLGVRKDGRLSTTDRVREPIHHCDILGASSNSSAAAVALRRAAGRPTQKGDDEASGPSDRSNAPGVTSFRRRGRAAPDRNGALIVATPRAC